MNIRLAIADLLLPREMSNLELMINVKCGKVNVASMLGPDGSKQMKIPLIYEYDTVRIEILDPAGDCHGSQKFG